MVTLASEEMLQLHPVNYTVHGTVDIHHFYIRDPVGTNILHRNISKTCFYTFFGVQCVLEDSSSFLATIKCWWILFYLKKYFNWWQVDREVSWTRFECTIIHSKCANKSLVKTDTSYLYMFNSPIPWRGGGGGGGMEGGGGYHLGSCHKQFQEYPILSSLIVLL